MACRECESPRDMACTKTETAMSRQEADLIAVLIFTYDSTRLLIHSGGTAVWDESLGRVPHSNLFVAEQIQIIQQFWAEGSTLTRWKRMSAGSLLSFSIRTDRIVRDGKRVNHDIHSLFHLQHLLSRRAISLPFRRFDISCKGKHMMQRLVHSSLVRKLIRTMNRIRCRNRSCT